MPDILVVQMARLGDFLQTTPLLCGIKEMSPDNRVIVLIDSANAEVAKKCGCVDEIISIDVDSILNEISDKNNAEEVFNIINKSCLSLSIRHFDDVINLNYSKIAAILSNMPESGRIYGYTLVSSRNRLSKDSWFVYFNNMIKHSPLSPFNLVDYFYFLYCKKKKVKKLSFNLIKSDHDKAGLIFNELNIGSDKKIISIHPGIRHEKRSWPIEYYAEVISKYLENKNIEIILTGSAEERFLADKLYSSISVIDEDKSRIHDLIGKTTISETAAVLNKSDMLLCGDTGIMHLATAVGVRILALFIGPASVYNTGPYSEGDLVLQTNHDCGPCVEDMICSDFGCRYTITPEIVYNASQMILEDSQDDITITSNIKLFRSKMDHWGVRYIPLNNPALDMKSLMNFCYREIGKKIISSDYNFSTEDNPHHNNQESSLIDSEFINGIITSGKVILNKAYIDTKWISEDRLKSKNSFWTPWIDSYLENCKYETRNSHEYIYALETGLKLIDNYLSANYEC